MLLAQNWEAQYDKRSNISSNKFYLKEGKAKTSSEVLGVLESYVNLLITPIKWKEAVSTRFSCISQTTSCRKSIFNEDFEREATLKEAKILSIEILAIFSMLISHDRSLFD